MSAAVIYVVDDDEMMRSSLEKLLRAQGYEVRTFASAGDFLLVPPRDANGCVVLDLEMPGPSGLELQAALARHAAGLPVVFLTGHGNVESSVRAMKAGAVDFLMKPVDPADLLEAIAEALERGRTARTRNASVGEAQARYAKLSSREREVFAQVVAGQPNKVIARALGITERTVKMHRAQVMAKMEAPTLAELVRTSQFLQT